MCILYIFDTTNIDISMKIEQVIFYSIDKAIKSYRQLAQQRLTQAGLDLTVDQWLILNMLRQSPGASQHDIAEKVFKDNASVTRMLDLLQDKKYIKRNSSKTDRRKTIISLTVVGKKLIQTAGTVVKRYRREALEDINEKDLVKAQRILKAISENCRHAIVSG